MTTVEDIENAVAKHAPEQLARFRAWFEGLFDERIERDAKAGKLDALAARARENHKAGRREEF